MSALLAEAADGTIPTPPAIRPVTNDAISVFIDAKDPILRDGVEQQLRGNAKVRVLDRTARRYPDVALVIADSVDDWVLERVRTFRKLTPSRIVVVADVSGQSADWATEAGANGVVRRSLADGAHLAWAVQKVHRGDSVPVVGISERTEATPPPSIRPVNDKDSHMVSDRDREVLRLLADGCDTGEIARTLAYSEPTIKNVIQRLFEQLKAKNRPNAVALALRYGIIV